MKARKVKVKEVGHLIKFISSWFSSVQRNKVNDDDFLYDISDCVVLNRILCLIPEAKVTEDDFFDPCENNLESNDNFNCFKSACIDRLGFEEEEFFDQSILQADSVDEVMNDENLLKLLRTIVSIAHLSLNTPKLTDGMSAEFTGYLSNEELNIPEPDPIVEQRSSSTSSPVIPIVSNEKVEKTERKVSVESIKEEKSPDVSYIHEPEEFKAPTSDEMISFETKPVKQDKKNSSFSTNKKLIYNLTKQIPSMMIGFIVGAIVGMTLFWIRSGPTQVVNEIDVPCVKDRDIFKNGDKMIQFRCAITDYEKSLDGEYTLYASSRDVSSFHDIKSTTTSTTNTSTGTQFWVIILVFLVLLLGLLLGFFIFKNKSRSSPIKKTK